MIGQILSALAAIPTIVNLVNSFAQAVTAWYISGLKSKDMVAIADAAAMAANAKTDEERYAASDAWHRALQLPRAPK